MSNIHKRGFASMSVERRKEIASKVGSASSGNFKHSRERAAAMGKLNKEDKMSKQETITLNGKTYVEFDPNKKDIQPAVETDHIIVIAQRGWIFEGFKDKSVTDKIQLLNANVVRSWSNGKGIGGLCNKSNKSDYKLDPVGSVSFPNEGVIATIDVTEW